MANEKGKEVTKAPVGAVPTFMRKDAGRGLQNIAASDIEMPRIKLLQGISEELTQFNGTKSGDFFHTLAEVDLGNELEFTPLHISKRYVLWNPRWDGGGILARADDAVHWMPPQGSFKVHTDKSKRDEVTWILKPTVAESGLAEWGTADPRDPKSQPAATLCYVIVADLIKYPELSPVAFMLQRTSIGPARKLMGKLKISGAPIYGTKFKVSSFVDSGESGDYNNYRFTMDGLVQDEELYERYKAMAEGFERTGVNVKDIAGAQEEGGAGGKGPVDETLASKI